MISDSAVAADDKYFVIEGYNLVRAECPGNLKRSGVFIYHKGKNHLPFN